MIAIANTNNEIPLTVEQGADFSCAFPAAVDASGNPIDISGYTASMKVRSSPYGSGANPGAVLLTLSDGSGLTLGSNGVPTVAVTNSQSVVLPYGRAWWDLLLTDGSGNVCKFAKGPMDVGSTASQ